MTGRTHDLAAFTAISAVVATQNLPQMSLATGVIALSAGFIGALAPDIDQPTANLWRRLPLGGVWGRLLAPVFGGHRFISHSLLGTFLAGFIVDKLLLLTSTVLLVNMQIVWWSFMIGYVSHLIIDTFNREGVPWLFPLPVKFGIPPLKAFRIKAGGMIETAIICPGLILINIWIYYTFYGVIVNFLKNQIVY